MIILRKNLPEGIIGEVPLKDEPGGNVIGTAKLEKVGTNIMVHVDAADIPEAIMEGFSLGSYSLYPEEKSDG